MRTHILTAISACLVILTPAAAQETPSAAPMREIARGVHMLPGAFYENRGPDGNTIIFDAPRGLVVVDTGRHPWHSDAILAYAQARGRPIAAIVNSHWHLDHSTGNRRLTARFPDAQVYTSNAIDRALAEDGFLRRSEQSIRTRLEDPNLSAIAREEAEKSLATMAAADTLRPDVALAQSGRMRIGGRRFDVHVAERAATDADVWLYDRRSRVVVLGDLVTMPGPFLDTACPDQWRTALDQIWAVPFRVAIPGHGEPMTREDFDVYRLAFSAYLDCAASDAEASVCGERWAEAVASLSGDENSLSLTSQNARDTAQAYVGFLRRNGGSAPDCLNRMTQ